MARPKSNAYDLSQRKLCSTLLAKFGGIEKLSERAVTLYDETDSHAIKAKLLDMAFSAVMSLKDDSPDKISPEDLQAELEQHIQAFGIAGVTKILEDDTNANSDS